MHEVTLVKKYGLIGSHLHHCRYRHILTIYIIGSRFLSRISLLDRHCRQPEKVLSSPIRVRSIEVWLNSIEHLRALVHPSESENSTDFDQKCFDQPQIAPLPKWRNDERVRLEFLRVRSDSDWTHKSILRQILVESDKVLYRVWSNWLKCYIPGL